MIPHVDDVRLVDGDDALQLMPHDPAVGLWLTGLDVGFPDVRDQVDEAVDADGTTDRTIRHGAKAVTLELVAPAPGAAVAVTRLRRWLHPARRPWLHYTPEGEPPQRIRLRTAQHAAPLAQLSSRGRIEASAQWRAPDGRGETVAESVAVANPADGETGRTYPWVAPRVYPETSGLGTATAVNAGTAAAWPVIRVYGPCTGPRVANETTGERLEFTAGLAVPAGVYLELDHRNRTARVNSSGAVGDSRLTDLDFAVSRWFDLPPGGNTIRFYPATHDRPCQAHVVWHDAYL